MRHYTYVWQQMSCIWNPMSDITHQTSVFLSSDVWHMISDVWCHKSNILFQTSYVWGQTSNNWHQSSDVWHQTCVLVTSEVGHQTYIRHQMPDIERLTTNTRCHILSLTSYKYYAEITDQTYHRRLTSDIIHMSHIRRHIPCVLVPSYDWHQTDIRCLPSDVWQQTSDTRQSDNRRLMADLS